MFQAILTFLLLIVIIYWICFYSAYLLLDKIKSDKPESLEGVSVIISCKNAEKTIKKTVDAILSQVYDNFELIVINDYSTDGTQEVLQHYRDPRMVLLSANINVEGKKAALTQAINQSKNEVLLFTDADCVPASNLWIKSMVQALLLDTNKEVVLGFGPMYENNSWINRFARFETWLTAMQYFSYAIFKIPYMGVGRNLLYKKSAFLRVNGFTTHDHIASGDDDLLIASVASSDNVVVNIDPEAFMFSEAKDSLASFLKQKTRHISTSVKYKLLHQILLSVFAASQIGFYFVLITGWAMNALSWQLISIVLISKWMIQSLLHFKWMQRLKSKDLFLYFPFLDILLSLYYVVLSGYGLFGKKRGW